LVNASWSYAPLIGPKPVLSSAAVTLLLFMALYVLPLLPTDVATKTWCWLQYAWILLLILVPLSFLVDDPITGRAPELVAARMANLPSLAPYFAAACTIWGAATAVVVHHKRADALVVLMTLLWCSHFARIYWVTSAHLVPSWQVPLCGVMATVPTFVVAYTGFRWLLPWYPASFRTGDTVAAACGKTLLTC